MGDLKGNILKVDGSIKEGRFSNKFGNSRRKKNVKFQTKETFVVLESDESQNTKQIRLSREVVDPLMLRQAPFLHLTNRTADCNNS